MTARVYQPERKPTEAQFLDGLPRIEPLLTSLQRRLLVEQYGFPDHCCFASDLAKRCDIQSHGVVNRHYALAAEKFCRATGFQPIVRENGKPQWWSVWSFGIDHPPSHWEWQMHPELATALEQLGWVGGRGSRDGLLPEEVTGGAAALEGAVCQIRVNAYERDAKLRARCVAAHGARCRVCDIDFGVAYGTIGEGFIHVHHARPLADGSGERLVDPIADLSPVCPNCHAMLHRQEPPLTIEQLRRYLRAKPPESSVREGMSP